MSVEIPYAKRYIYNLDESILESLRTLYFDSITFEQKTEKEFLQRRKDEIEDAKAQSITDTLENKPMIVQPKPRNTGLIVSTLTNLKLSKTKEDDGDDDTKSKEKEEKGSGSEVSESENETDSEPETGYDDNDSDDLAELSVIKENGNLNEENYDSQFIKRSTIQDKFSSLLFKNQSIGSINCLLWYIHIN